MTFAIVASRAQAGALVAATVSTVVDRPLSLYKRRSEWLAAGILFCTLAACAVGLSRWVNQWLLDARLARALNAADAVQAYALIRKGASPHVTASDHTTVVFLAAEADHQPLLSEALRQGVPADLTPADGLTPLMGASIKGSIKSIHTLVAYGARIDAKDSDGSTALMFASEAHLPRVVQALLAAGADVSAVDRDGAAALDYAKREPPTHAAQRQNQERVFALLRAHGAGKPKPRCRRSCCRTSRS